MKYFDSNNLISRKGQFDLQGFKPKSQKLPSLNLAKVRSTTPEFQSLSISTNEISSRLNKSPDPIILKSFERVVLPNDSNSIKELLKPLSVESFALSPGANPLASSRQSLINLEQWFFKMLKTENQDQEAVFDLCLQELSKEISLQCINSARITVILFTTLKKFWQNQVFLAREEEKFNFKEENLKMTEKVKQASEDAMFFKSGMEEYLQKYLKSDDKSLLLSRENHILKQVLMRIQQEYKIQTLDLSKISDLIIEDLSDYSKRTQKRIINSIIPKCFQNIQVQTIESLIIQTHSTQVQTSPRIETLGIQVSPETQENFSQTIIPNRRKRNLGIFPQFSLKIFPKQRVFIKVDRKKDLKVNLPRAEVNFSSNHEEDQTIHSNPSNKSLIPGSSYSMGNYFHSSKPLEFYNVSRRHSQVSSSSYSEDLKPSQRLVTVQELRPFTPQPVIKSSLKRRKVVNLSKKSKEVLEYCLGMNAKDLSYEATLSVRTLVKTIESMFYSCIPLMKLGKFKGFLEHVYRKLSNKYSLKKMKEKRLRDLISASIREKDLLMSKLFLRSIGAGSLIGMSNYSIHTFKIILQILNFFNNHLFASPFFTSTGKKFASKGKVLEISRELFEKRLEKQDFLKLLHQVEHHTESDSGMVDIEWIVSYLVFLFDTFEKQVIAGTQKMMQAVMVVPSLFPSKDEFLLALRTLHVDFEVFLKDKTCLNFFPFLSEKVSGKSLISSALIEKFALFRGLFKIKYVENFKKKREKIEEIEFDDLAFVVDNTNEKCFGSRQAKDDLLVKIWKIREAGDPDLSFLIYSQEVSRLIEKQVSH